MRSHQLSLAASISITKHATRGAVIVRAIGLMYQEIQTDRVSFPAGSVTWQKWLVVAAMICVLALSERTLAQDDNDASGAAGAFGAETLVNPVSNRWKLGVQIRGGAAPVKNCLITIPVPTNWPEQHVQLEQENVPPEVRRVKFRELNSHVEQLVIQLPQVNAGQLIEVSMIYRVQTGQILPPENTDEFRIPKRVDREFREYLSDSPKINFRNSKLQKQVKEIINGVEGDWNKVRAIFDWVRENVEYSSGRPRDILEAFREKHGCEEDLNGLFVGMCRIAKVPARMVWVEGNVYSEFMLVDAEDKPHWFPAQVAGRAEFGSMMEPRIILQKGDDIKVPEKKERQSYVAEFVACKGAARPQVRFIRQRLPDAE